jgi:hypothetical protein
MLLGSVVWCLLIVLFAAKWLSMRAKVEAELQHSIFCCFIGLAPLTVVLVALAMALYQRAVAVALFVVGSLGQLAFGLYRTGQLWMGGRDPNATTPVLYLPSVAGSFVSSIGASALGFPDWAISRGGRRGLCRSQSPDWRNRGGVIGSLVSWEVRSAASFASDDGDSKWTAALIEAPPDPNMDKRHSSKASP